METTLEDRTKAILAHVDQQNAAQMQRLENLEKMFVSLKVDQGQEQKARQNEVATLGKNVESAFRGIMKKMDDRMQIPMPAPVYAPTHVYAPTMQQTKVQVTSAAPVEISREPKPAQHPPLKIDRSRHNFGRPFLATAQTYAHPHSAPSHGNKGHTEIRAVGTSQSPDKMGLTIIPPQILSLVLGKGPAQFSGQRADWPEWKRKFLRFMGEIQETTPTISNRQLLTVLRNYLDEGSIANLETTLLSNPDLEFSAFWAKLEIEMGGDDREEARAKWHNLKLRHQGSVRLADWRNFIGEFLRLKILVDGSEDEAKSLLMRILPIEFRKKVLQEEDKRGHNELQLLGLGGCLLEQVQELIKNECGVDLKGIWKRGEKVVLRVKSTEEKERIFQMLDRERLSGGGLISVQKELNAISVEEIDEIMRRWLTVEERAKIRDGVSPPNPNPPRWQREVQTKQDENVGGLVQEVKVETKAKWTQANIQSGESTPQGGKSKGASKGGQKGGRGRSENVPFSAPPAIPPTPTPTAPMNVPNPNFMGFPTQTPPPNWYPPAVPAYPMYPLPPMPDPQGGYFANPGKGKGEKGWKGGKSGKGGH